jgi:hypothetical protein
MRIGTEEYNEKRDYLYIRERHLSRVRLLQKSERQTFFYSKPSLDDEIEMAVNNIKWTGKK